MIKRRISRRTFTAAAASVPLLELLPRGILGLASNNRQVRIRTDSEIGLVRPELHGHFAEHLGACIYGGIWVGRNSPVPNVNGYRKLAVEYLRELGVPVLRWPGGCFADDYHWRDGVGPAANRPKRVNLHWGGYVEDNSFGTDEFIGFCREIGAEPYICGNVGSGSPEELRDWIEYCNFPSGSTLADERIRNGYAEPHRVRYWGVGNENWGCGGNMTAKEYAGLFRRFAVFAPAFGGLKPFLIACGPNRNDTSWSRDFMDSVPPRRLPQGFAMHYYAEGKDNPAAYTPADMAAQLATFPDVEQAVIQQRALLDGYDSGRNVGLILDEWGVHDRVVPSEEKVHGRLWQECTMRSALAIALGLNLFNRQADKLFMCNLTQTVNVRAPLLQTDGPEGQRCIRTTVYYVFELFKPHRSKTAVRVEAEGADSARFSVSASRQDRDLVISLVNASADEDMHIDCSLAGERPASASAQILHSDDLNASNGFDGPEAIGPQSHPSRVEGSSIQLDLPRLSVSTIKVRLV
jgi:alpha-L-arabinofuranosidase